MAVDGHPGAGQVLQVLGVVLVPEHVGKLAASSAVPMPLVPTNSSA
jgi:hypothetical protein